MTDICVLCGTCDVEEIYSDRAASFSRYAYYRSSEDALLPSVSLRILFCKECGWAWNASPEVEVAYDRLLVMESASYSSEFQRFQRETAKLITSILGDEIEVMEIGAGAGEFLDCLPMSSKTAFEPSREAVRVSDGINVVKEYYDPKKYPCDYDLVVMRQVLEHIAKPLEFLQQTIDSAIILGRHINLYIEVPNSSPSFATGRYYDFYYEHFNHFSVNSLCVLGRRLGLSVNFCCPAYNSALIQCLMVSNGPNRIVERIKKRRSEIREFIDRAIETHGHVFVWGSAGNGCFLIDDFELDKNICPIVIDGDPVKNGLFLGKYKQKIMLPNEAFSVYAIKAVIICSQVHSGEIVLEVEKYGIVDLFVV